MSKDFGYTSLTGRFYCTKPGRPSKMIGEVHCKECGELLRIRPYRFREEGNYCKKCANRRYMPPLHINGDIYIRGVKRVNGRGYLIDDSLTPTERRLILTKIESIG